MPNDQAELSTVVHPRASSAVAEIGQSRAIAEVQASMLLARRFPRDELAARDKIVNAFTRSSLAEVAKYSYARGGTDIEGPSIHSLQAIARLWGNVRCGVEEVSRAHGQSECRAYAMDTETGFYDEKTFVVRHIRDTKRGPVPITEERDIYEIIANMGARRKRACLESVIPDDVIEDAMAQVEVTLKTKFEITPEFLSTLIGAFGKFGVTKAMIELRIQRHVDAMTPAQAVSLKKIHTSLKEGIGKPEDFFDLTAGAVGGDDGKPAATATEGVKDKLRKRQQGGEPKSAEATKAPEPQAQQPTEVERQEVPVTLAAVLGYIDKAPSADIAEQALDLARALSPAERAEATATFNKKWAQVIE